MQSGVTLQIMIEAAISAYFQLRPDSQTSSLGLCLADRLNDALEVALKVKGPLIEGACCEGAMSFACERCFVN